MNIIYQYLTESVIASVPFVIHKHDARSANIHYDLRFMDAKNDKLLHSFACAADFIDTLDTKNIPLIKTRDHDPRWLTLKSYRLEVADEGVVDIMINTSKFFRLTFNGKVIKGTYKLFHIRASRDDQWLLSKEV